MKKLFRILALSLFLCGCGTNEPPKEEIHRTSGIVESVLPGSISVYLNATEETYSFPLNESVDTTEPYNIGDVVMVKYTGSLDAETYSFRLSTLSHTHPIMEPSILDNSFLHLFRTQEILQSMSLEEKVSQLFLARVPDINAVERVQEFQPGGYILFGQDFEDYSPEEVTQHIASYQEASKIPMLIAVDEEGGTVTRVSYYPQFRSSRFPSPQTLYATNGFDSIVQDAMEKAQLLRSLGINVNMAPVCDITENPDDYMYERSFAQSPALTSTFVEKVVTTSAQYGVSSVLKHFPGYGNNENTHTGIAYDNRPYETFTTSDFLPFEAGIRAGADCVLVSHNIVTCMDPNAPSSLSSEVHRILREELHYNGAIMTDDLAMEAIKDYCGDEAAAVTAILAGNDILCSSDFTTQIPAVIEAVRNGTITEERINESVLRILQWKINRGIIS